MNKIECFLLAFEIALFLPTLSRAHIENLCK